MRRTAALFGALIAIASVAMMASAADGDVPQLDSRALHFSEGGSLKLAAVDGVVYLVGRQLRCVGDEDPQIDLALCVYGPIALETTDTPEIHWQGAPEAPLLAVIYLPDEMADGHWDITASGGDGTLQLAVISQAHVHVLTISTDGSAETGSTYDLPCESTSRVFDASTPVLWFSCGPVALNYETGAQIIYVGSHDLIVARPDGGVAGLTGGDAPSLGVFDTTRGDIYALDDVPVGSVFTSASSDVERGIVAQFESACEDPCELDPADPPLPGSPALVDLNVMWIGWNGEVDADFGVVRLATSTGGSTHVATDGDSTIALLPKRSAPDPCSKCGVRFWRRVGANGVIDAMFGIEPEWGLNFVSDFEFVGDEIVTVLGVDNVARVQFWHLTDQGTFFDDAGLFEDDIEVFAAAGITLGCNVEGNLFCPDDLVTRAQMASFISRWLGLDLDAPDLFDDDAGSTHEPSINAIAAAGITLGCSGADPTLFCPGDVVTRAQMASFIQRALGLPDNFSNRFIDDDGLTHEAAIDAIAHEGITLGCDTSGTLYCPNDPVSRKHMAAFIVRAGVTPP